MNLRREMRTDRRLWLWMSLVAFVLLGSVSPWTESIEYKIGRGDFWGMLFQGPRGWEIWRFPLILACYAAILVIPSIILGWVAQGILVSFRLLKNTEKISPPSN